MAPQGDGNSVGNGVSVANQTPLALQKLTVFQTLIPAFDAISSVSAKFYFQTIESLATEPEFNEGDRLIVAKSRLRGEALAYLINSNLNNIQDYKTFKEKFLEFFDTKQSRAVAQYKFSNLKMLEGEQAKTYGNRVSTTTDEFFGDKDLNTEGMINIYEDTRLNKFIQGIRPEYRMQLITKDPKTFREAVDFIELLETNAQLLATTHSVNAIGASNTDSLLTKLLQNTQEQIATLTKQMENLQTRKVSGERNLDTRNRGTPSPGRQKLSCRICYRDNHDTERCYQHPNNRRQQTVGQNTYRGESDRSRPTQRNWRRENNSGNSSRNFTPSPFRQEHRSASGNRDYGSGRNSFNTSQRRTDNSTNRQNRDFQSSNQRRRDTSRVRFQDEAEGTNGMRGTLVNDRYRRYNPPGNLRGGRF